MKKFTVKKCSAKKIIFFFSVLFFSSLNVFAQMDDEVRQVMVPRDVYIGDTGQIQFSFRTPEDFFVIAEEKNINDDVLELHLTESDLFEHPESGTVLKSVLIRNGVNYNLCITLIPWKVGTVTFKTFDLKKICTNGRQEGFEIKLSPIVIASLTEKLGVMDLRSVNSPLVLPGTNYVLWALFIAAFVFLILIALVILRLNFLIKKIKKIYVAFGFYRNARATRKLLKKLLRNKSDDKTFCLCWQKIFRKYLAYRFAASFDSVPAGFIEQKIYRCTGELASAKQINALEKLSSLFIRTDYIRFADGSIDSKILPAETHQAVLAGAERKSIVEDSMTIITVLEQNEQEEENV